MVELHQTEDYYKYYDYLFAKKDYKQEAQNLLDMYKSIKNCVPSKILDIGCGTGSHAFVFAGKNIETVGIDLDPEIIAIAQRKLGQSGNKSLLRFQCEDVAKLNESDFDLIVSLFNVINYIPDINLLNKFFAASFRRLNENGIFIFDCWNGIAAILDNPRQQKRVMDVDGLHIAIETTPETNLMAQTVIVTNKVTITGEQNVAFTFTYNHRLWTPATLKDALGECGFEPIDIVESGNLRKPASEQSWKISFLCRKH